MAFTEMFLEFTKEYESPTSFWKWTSYAIIASILRDNVYWMQGSRKVCPNVWVLLMADSAVHRKSGPIIEASKLLNELKVTKFIRGRSSVQAILDDLAAVTTDKQTGKVIRGGACLLCADELASFFVSDPSLIALLTDIYDFREEWQSSLKSGKFRITNLCVSFLAASNETFLKKVYTEEAVYGGLLGRTFMIKPDEYRPGNSLIATEDTNGYHERYDLKPMIEELRKIEKVKGEVKFTKDAKNIYDAWYHPLRDTYRHKPDKTGVVQRLHTGVLKLATILAVSRNLSLNIQGDNVTEAIEMCTSIIGNYEAYAMSTGKSSESAAGAALLADMWANNGSVSRKEFLTKNWTDVSAELLDKLLISLDQAGLIKRVVDMTGETYTMTTKCKEIYERKLK